MARTTAEKPAPDTDPGTGPDSGPDPVETEPAEDLASGVEPGEEETTDRDGTEPESVSAEDAEDAESEEPEEPAEPEKRRRWRVPRVSDPVVLVATVLAVVAAACAGYFAWSWYGAAHDDSLAYSRDRDTVLRAAEQGVQNMNTLDYRKADQGLTSWEDSSTGDLRQELVSGRAQFTAQVQLAKTVTTAKILDGAVTELDTRTGKAGAIVAVQITVTPPKGSPTTKQSRLRAQLARTPFGWKLSALGQAAVGTTANGG